MYKRSESPFPKHHPGYLLVTFPICIIFLGRKLINGFIHLKEWDSPDFLSRCRVCNLPYHLYPPRKTNGSKKPEKNAVRPHRKKKGEQKKTHVSTKPPNLVGFPAP